MLKDLLEDYDEIVDLFNSHNNRLIYQKYRQVIDALVFVTSEEEFEDFIFETGDLEMDSFLLELAAQREICFSLSINDELSVLIEYIENISGIVCNHSVGRVEDILKTANEREEQMRYVAFYDDRYSEGMYYIFHVKKETDFEICDCATVKQIV